MTDIPDSENREQKSDMPREEGGQLNYETIVKAGGRIQDWVERNLGEDVGIAVDLLLTQLEELGYIACTLVDGTHLRFSTKEHELCSVETENARARLRMMCARLANICSDQGRHVSPYGGETEFNYPTSKGNYSFAYLRFKNTTGCQEFSLEKPPQ